VTYDGDRTGKIYLNGIQVGKRFFPDQLSIFKTNFFVGKRYISNPEFLQGSLDDIRIYNRALSESEIKALYHEGGWQ
jgi:arabinan endo-1,5-alpha-L-arabinosidase